MPVTKRKGKDVVKEPLDAAKGEITELKSTLNLKIAEVQAQKHKHHHEHKWYTKRRVLFPIGLAIGLAAGLSFIEPQHLSALPANVSLFLQDLPSLPQMDLSRVEAEFTRLRSALQIPEVWKLNTDGREFQVGDQAKARGLTAKYPVVLIPGIISTGLESWSTSPEYREFFRMRVWGGMHMVSQVMYNREKWMASLMLDPVTGLDPAGVKVRAAEGIEAASSFIQGYWLWSKIIENLAVVNYDTNNLYLAPYDWRLSYANLEERDGYFSRLKGIIEGFKERQGQKIVLASHSMGSSVILYFFKWVESPNHGKGGPSWVEDHIEAHIAIAGTHLGVAKAMTAYLSGEMRDTVQLNPAGAYIMERFFSKRERQKLFLSWAGGASMWIKGGTAVWGDENSAPDDPLDNKTHTYGSFISFRPPPPAGEPESPVLNKLDDDGVLGHRTPSSDDPNDDSEKEAEPEGIFARAAKSVGLSGFSIPGTSSPRLARDDDRDMPAENLTANGAGTWILQRTPGTFQRMMASNYSNGFERDEEQLKANDGDPTKWSNPLEVRLPNAPSMKIFCVYGHGKQTERSYWYARGDYEYDDVPMADVPDGTCPDTGHDSSDSCKSPRPALDMPLSRRNWIDYAHTDASANPQVVNGVSMGEGDGTVSLLSLGAMCVEGWKRKRYNPAGIKVVTVELPHNPSPTIPRGGANTSDHVDILGSTGLNDVIVRVATGAGHEIQDSFVSSIREYAARIRWD